MYNKIKKIYNYILFKFCVKSVSRIVLDRQLKRVFKKLEPGIVMDIGSMNSPYKKLIPYKKYLRMDIDDRTEPDIVGDIHNIQWQTEYFDTVIATEVLEHTHSPKKAVKELYKVLKKDGVCILSTRFIYPYHGSPYDYYRFTIDSLKDIFEDYSNVKVYTHGNRVLSAWQLLIGPDNQINPVTVFLSLFNPLISIFNTKKSISPLGYVVYARK